MLRKVLFAAAVVASVALVGCRSEGQRVDNDIEAVQTHEFNPTDLELVQKTVGDLLKKPVLTQEAEKPFVYVSKVRNNTNEHVNTQIIAQAIRAKISQSDKVRISGVPDELNEAVRALEFQQGPYVDPTTARKIGKMVGAKYFIQGELSNIESKSGWKKGQYFLFTLSLIDIETLEQWIAEPVRIQKVSKRGLFGW